MKVTTNVEANIVISLDNHDIYELKNKGQEGQIMSELVMSEEDSVPLKTADVVRVTIVRSRDKS